MVTEHERDGRGWKAEWPAFDETCLLAGAALAAARDVVAGLRVYPDAMCRNIDREGGYLSSGPVLAALAPALGKHRAQALLQEALAQGLDAGQAMPEVVESLPVDPEVKARLRHAAAARDTGAAGAMVDDVVKQGRRRRAREDDRWP